MKINKIKEQSATTPNCGYFAMNFLINRLNGRSYKFCSGYSDIKNGEQKIKLLKNKFGYI